MNRQVAALLSLPCLAISHAAVAQKVMLDLPAGPLGRAVDALAQQGATSVILADPSLWDRRVPAVRGWMSAEAAVRALARYAGAEASPLGPAGWRVVIGRPRRRVPTPAPLPRAAAIDPPEEPKAEIVVLASKRGVGADVFAGSVEMIAAPPVSIEGGTAALVTQSTIISSTYRGAGREKLFIRGLSDSGFSGRLQSVTGLYFGDVRLTYSASDPDLQLYDMRSVEVLQGAQGTLYGSGSLAGIIRMDPVMPRRGMTQATIGGGVSATAHGSRGRDLDVMFNMPLAGNLAVRAVGYSRTEPGYIDKPALASGPASDVNSTRIDGARAIIRWWIADGWTLDATGIVQGSRSRDTQYSTVEAPPLTDVGRIAEPFESDYAAAHLTIKGRIGVLELTSATGMAAQDFRERFYLADVGDPRTGDTHRRHTLVTHETRLSRRGDGGMGWVAGISYTRPESRAEFREQLIVIHSAVSEVALFGEGALRVASFLALGAGARVGQATTRSRVTTLFGIGNERQQRQRWFLPTASAMAQPLRELSMYARYQEGVRPMVVQSSTMEDVNNGANERVATLEAGLHLILDSGWSASASILRSRWRQLQVDTFEVPGVVSGTFGDWRLTSIHGALSGPVAPGLRLDAAVTINRNAPVSPLIGGLVTTLPDVADVIVRAEATWAWPITHADTLNLRGWVRYEGHSSGYFPRDLPEPQGNYLRSGIMADVDRGENRWTLSVDNLLDVLGNRYAVGSIARNGTVTPLRPLTVRIGYRRSF